MLGVDVFLSHDGTDATVVEEIAVRLEEGAAVVLGSVDPCPTALERAVEGTTGKTVAVSLEPASMGPHHHNSASVRP